MRTSRPDGMLDEIDKPLRQIVIEAKIIETN